MGGTKKFSKFYCAMGEQNAVSCKNCANRAGNVHSVTDDLNINEQNTSIATGSLYLYIELDAI